KDMIPPLLQREIQGATIRGPLRRALAVVDDRSDFAPVASIGTHDPDVSVLHGSLTVGNSPPSAAIGNLLSVWGPDGVVLVIFRRGKALYSSVGDIQGE